MVDKEFTQICKEILGVSKKLEKIEPDELKKIKTDIERISEAVATDKTLFDTNKKDFDGKYNKIAEIITTFDTLKAQIEEVLKSGIINDSAEALISTYSSKKIMDLLNEAKGAVDEKFSTIYKNGITPWSSSLDYPAGAISVLNGKLYQARTQNINKKPSENKEEWRVLASEEWCEQTFLNKDEKIDTYSKTESDDKFALKSDITDGLKIGSYLLWSSQSVTPAGYLLCDGRSLKKSEYNELFAVIGYTYGGSGENFNIPKFNDGRFMRSTGGNAAALGIVQQDELKSHKHYQYCGGNVPYSDHNNQVLNPPAQWIQNISISAKGWTSEVGGNETRPYNSSVIVLIKVKDVKEPNKNEVDKSIYATESKAGIIKIKNSITGVQEDVAVSEKAVANIASIGINQTWQDMTSQRRKDVVYTNTTNRPILINIRGVISSSSEDIYITVDGKNLAYINVGSRSGTLTVIIPSLSTYKLQSSSGSAVNNLAWFELR